MTNPVVDALKSRQERAGRDGPCAHRVPPRGGHRRFSAQPPVLAARRVAPRPDLCRESWPLPRFRNPPPSPPRLEPSWGCAPACPCDRCCWPTSTGPGLRGGGVPSTSAGPSLPDFGRRQTWQPVAGWDDRRLPPGSAPTEGPVLPVALAFHAPTQERLVFTTAVGACNARFALDETHDGGRTWTNRAGLAGSDGPVSIAQRGASLWVAHAACGGPVTAVWQSQAGGRHFTRLSLVAGPATANPPRFRSRPLPRGPCCSPRMSATAIRERSRRSICKRPVEAAYANEIGCRSSTRWSPWALHPRRWGGWHPLPPCWRPPTADATFIPGGSRSGPFWSSGSRRS